MTANAEKKGSVVDIFIHVLALIALFGGVYGYYHFEEQSALYSTLVVLAGLFVATGLVYVTSFGKSAASYIKAANTERRKVVWPTRQETARTLIAVIVIVSIASVFLWLCDKLAGKGVELLLG